MYEDSWYSFVPDLPATNQTRKASSQGPGHKRKESLLQQPNGTNNIDAHIPEPLENVFEEIEDTRTPPEPTLVRRAASYSDFYHVARAQISKGETHRRKKAARNDRQWEALMICESATKRIGRFVKQASPDHSLETELLDASQEEYLIYRDQLILTERHLDGLIEDANATLKLLTTLSNSFKSVETQTSSFQSNCEDLLNEQRRLETLADNVGTDLHYYGYLELATRRLNSPGASRLVDDDAFGEMIDNIDSCIVFMNDHEKYRDRDQYLARYNALLTKALHLLDHGFTNRLDKIMSDIGRQIAATQSESARHALAYGRFEEMIMETYSLVPNIQKVVRRAFDQYGRPAESSHDTSTYKISTTNIFQTHLTTRDRELKVMAQHDIQEYQQEIKSLSLETASRNLIKLCFERAYNEEELFVKIFHIDPAWSSSPDSVFQALKGINTTMVHPAHLEPLFKSLQTPLRTTDLKTICSIVGWLASEYSIVDLDEEESLFFRKCREYAARLLVHNLWPLTDSSFEAEITKSITKGAVLDSELKIGPVEHGVASSNAFPLIKKAVGLLAMFDQAMPKERSSKDSPVVFNIVRESIQVLQRAEARIKSIKNGTDPDLFVVKNLLIIKNELVSLEIGDIRGQASSMQHFGQIWETLSPTNWVGFFGNIISNSIWSRGTPAVTAKTLTVEDMSEQLDELLRQSIYAFTKRWATLMNDSKARKAGVKPIAKVETELEIMLQTAFSNQPEVIAKLKEAIQLNAQAQNDAKDGAKRY